jgi:TRAP-type C4-dicarboxylate transport system substrate-binding protein
MKKIHSFKLLLGIAMMLALAFVISTAQAAQGDKPIILKFSTWHPSPPANVFADANTWILREVEKRSNGRVKFEYYWSGSLVPAKKMLDGLKSGLTDIGFMIASYFPGMLPLATVGGLPVICHNYYATAMTLTEMMQLPELKAEFNANNIMYLSHSTNISNGIWTKNRVRSIADLKGKKIVAVGEGARVLNALGVTPVAIITSEIYQAIEKGTADGGVANPGWAGDYKLPEVAPYYFELTLGAMGDMFTAINKKSWERLPPDIQKMFIDLREEAIIAGRNMYQGNAERNLKGWVSKGTATVSKPSAADWALLEKTANSVVWEGWVNKMEKKGLPGRKILKTWMKLYKKYDAQEPPR